MNFFFIVIYSLLSIKKMYLLTLYWNSRQGRKIILCADFSYNELNFLRTIYELVCFYETSKFNIRSNQVIIKFQFFLYRKNRYCFHQKLICTWVLFHTRPRAYLSCVKHKHEFVFIFHLLLAHMSRTIKYRYIF